MITNNAACSSARMGVYFSSLIRSQFFRCQLLFPQRFCSLRWRRTRNLLALRGSDEWWCSFSLLGGVCGRTRCRRIAAQRRLCVVPRSVFQLTLCATSPDDGRCDKMALQVETDLPVVEVGSHTISLLPCAHTSACQCQAAGVPAGIGHKSVLDWLWRCQLRGQCFRMEHPPLEYLRVLQHSASLLCS
jgi:hypothetical protein